MTKWHYTVKYIQIRDYQLAVDKFEALSVQRLLELSKANLSGTSESMPCPAHSRLTVFLDLGYKLHMHISKALQTRCAAIKTALKRYNATAAKIDLPHPKLDWTDILEYGTLAEFKLLHWGACEDIRESAWADQVNLQVAIYGLQVEQAQQEIQCLNVEVAHLHTWMSDEEGEFDHVTSSLGHEDMLLCAEVKVQHQCHMHVNYVHHFQVDLEKDRLRETSDECILQSHLVEAGPSHQHLKLGHVFVCCHACSHLQGMQLGACHPLSIRVSEGPLDACQ